MSFYLVLEKSGLLMIIYEEFVKLSRYAPLMMEEQKLSRFILGFKGQLAEEVNALRPISLADALIRAKAKLFSLYVGDRKRSNPYLPSGSFRPQKVNPPVRSATSNSSNPVAPRPFVQ